MAEEKQTQERVERILTENTHALDEDEKKACLRLWRAIAKRKKIRSKPEVWAAGVYYTYCRMVLKEEVSKKTVEELFNVSRGAFTSRCTEIRKLLDLNLFDKRFTPPKIYAESPFPKLEKALSLLYMEGSVSGYFEVKEKRRERVLLINLEDGGEYLAEGKTVLNKLKIGQLLQATLYPHGDAHVFAEAIKIFDPRDAHHRAYIESVKDYLSGNSLEKALEIQKDYYEGFKQYFGSPDPIFENQRKAQNALNAFINWYSYERKRPGKEKTPAQSYLETHARFPEMPEVTFPREFLEAEDTEVGVVFDEIGGIYILPHYSEVKELFKGDYRKVPDYPSLVDELVTEEGFIPAFLIRKMINENPEKAVTVFSATYKKVKTLADIFELFEKQRSDWKKKPQPSIIPIKY